MTTPGRVGLEFAPVLAEALRDGALSAVRESSLGTPVSAGLAAVKEVAAWKPPAGPGGIALNPRLRIRSDIGLPKLITLAGGAVAIVTDTGRYAVPGLDPSMFATLTRTVARGEIPFVTIGSLPSGKPGYARVTYSPSLVNTREGAILYNADLHFKSMFANLPFSDIYPDADDLTRLVAGNPGLGGDSLRFWITSNEIVLAVAGHTLEAIEPGVRIRGETSLRGEPVGDPAIEVYTERLTANWELLASRIPEYRAVEKMILATALAFWSREHEVAIDPLILTLPTDYQLTPSHTRLLGFFGNLNGITGGVTLTPSESRRSPARYYLHFANKVIARLDGIWESPAVVRSVLWAGIATAFGLFVLLPAMLLARGTGRPGEGGGATISLRRGVAVWLAVAGLHFSLAIAAVSAEENLELESFDRDFLAFTATFLAFPLILLFAWRRVVPAETGTGGAPALKFSTLAMLAVLGPIMTAMMSGVLATAILCATRYVPSRDTELAIAYTLAPAHLLSRNFLSVANDPRTGVRIVQAMPKSAVLAMNGPISLEQLKDKPERDVIDCVEPPSALLPCRQLHKVRWPRGFSPPSDTAYFTVDGKPPY